MQTKVYAVFYHYDNLRNQLFSPTSARDLIQYLEALKFAMESSSSNEAQTAVEEVAGNAFELLENPVKLITQGGKFGVKGVGKFFGIVILFAIVNFFLLLYGMYREAVGTLLSNGLLYLGGMLLFGIGVTVLAGYKAYVYVRTDALRIAYEKLRPYFPGYCRKLVDRVADQKIDPNNPNIQHTLDIVSFFNTSFQKFPGFIRRYLVKKISKIPFVQFFRELHQQLLAGNRDVVADTIYQRTDAFLTDNFKANNTRWILWLLPLNVVLQIILALQIV